ncbi:MAG: hypothetical protein ACKOPR_01555 [Chakrabartia godavariana]
MTGPDPHFDAALDRFTVPAPRAGMLDDLVAAAQSRAAPSPQPWERAPRDRRGGWLRGHRAFAISLAATIMSATAAAAAGGWLGEAGTRLPVIAQIASVMPEAVKAPSIRKAEAHKAHLAVAKPTAAEAAKAAPTDASVVPPPRAEKIIDRVEARLDARDARRAAKGLPANTAQERALLDRFRSAETPAARREVLQEARVLRQERRAEHAARPVCTAEQAAHPRANRCRPQLSPERRAEMEDRLCARLAALGRTPPRCQSEGPGEAVPSPAPNEN